MYCLTISLAHMSEAGIEQKYIKEAFDTNWVNTYSLWSDISIRNIG